MMQIRALVWGLGLVMALGVVGCGGEQSPAASGGSVAGAAGSMTGAGGSVSGAAGSGGASAGGSGQVGPRPLDCSGTFGAPVPGMPAAEEMGVRLSSPTLSPDGLELIYAREQDLDIGFRRAVRTSVDEPFPLGAPLLSLDAACMPGQLRSADLSSDGLRVYVGCYSAVDSPVGPATLHVAERASLTAELMLRPETHSVGPSAAISVDELTLLSTSMIDIGGYPPRQFRRASLDAMFDGGSDIPGLEAVNMTAPDLAPDGLSIYGGLTGNLVVAVRPSIDAPFGAPTILYEAPAPYEALGAPEVSRDCRTLLYLHQTTVEAVTGSKLMMARR